MDMGQYEKECWLTLCWVIRTCMHLLTFHGASVIRTCMCWVIQTCMRVPKHFQPLENYLQRANMRTRRGGLNEIKGSIMATYAIPSYDHHDLHFQS